MFALILLVALLLAPLAAHAQDPAPPPVSLSGQVRLRSELDDRGLTFDETVLAHLLRTRLRATAHPGPLLTIVVEVQDSRFLGSGDPALARGTTDVTADGLDMKQAFVQIERPLDLAATLRLGRQELSFANERLIGAFGWSNTGRSFDAARGTLNVGDDIRLDLFAARLSAPAAGPTMSQNLYGIWGAWKVGGVSVDLIALHDDNTRPIVAGSDSNKSLLARNTFGFNIASDVGPVNVLVEAIGQNGYGGVSDSLARKDLKAYLVSGTFAIAVDAGSGTKVVILGTVLSGDGSANDTINETFNTLFATNHKFYGSMDYFPSLSADAGLVDLGVGVATNLFRNTRVSLDGHVFRAQRRSTDPFGTEVDGTIVWKGAAGFELSGGASLFMPGEQLKARLGDAARFWAFMSGQWNF